MKRVHLAATLFAAALLILIGFAVALAQGPGRLVLYLDRNSLIVYVPADSGLTSLQGLGFIVDIQGTPHPHRLEEYDDLRPHLSDIHPPVCFRLQLDLNLLVPELPVVCNSIYPGRLFYDELSVSDIFWYDDYNDHIRDVAVVDEMGRYLGYCPGRADPCDVIYTPPTFTPTSSLPTLTLTPSPTPDLCIAPPSPAMYPVPGPPVVEIDVAPVSNEAFQVFFGCGGCDESAQWWPSTPNGRVWRSVFSSCPVPETFPAGQAQVPRTGVPWYVANALCRWRGARLPAADEWSWAAQGNVPGWVSQGPEWLSDGDGSTYAIIIHDDDAGGPRVVGQCAPNYSSITLDATTDCTGSGSPIGFRCARDG